MYQIDYDVAVENLIVPDKRQPIMVALNKVLAKTVSVSHDMLFNTYKSGAILPNWIAGSYAKGYRVRYGNSIFQSDIDSNTDEPTFSNNWILVTDNFLGNDFRLSIRGEKLNLEYALNYWFNTIFRQPPLVSDIYLTTNEVLTVSVFRVGISENESSKVYANTSSELIVNNYTFLNQYNLTINIPIVTYNSLALTDDARNSIVRSFADKYINAGITYIINTY